jgi:hypothetical protein
MTDGLALLRNAGASRKCLCHFTYANPLPDIATSGGLLPAAGRTTPSAHSSGPNAELAPQFVCCSFRPSWAILGAMRGKEVALLLINADTALRERDSRFVPMNTASPDAKPYITATVPGPQAVRECRNREMETEVLVRAGVPLAAIRGAVFHDEEARRVWWPAFVAAAELPDSHFDLGSSVDGATLDAFRFPPGHVTTTRMLVRPGRDRRRAAAPALLAPTTTSRLTWAEVEADLWDEEDFDSLDERRQILEELDEYAEQMAALEDTGWFYSDDERGLYRGHGLK